jgi:hypothetical protein
VYSAVLSKISYIFVLKWPIYHWIFTMKKILSTINFNCSKCTWYIIGYNKSTVLLWLFYISLSDVRIPVKSHAFSVRVMLQDVKSRSHVHANTKIQQHTYRRNIHHILQCQLQDRKYYLPPGMCNLWSKMCVPLIYTKCMNRWYSHFIGI